jgi:hypothetical protein
MKKSCEPYNIEIVAESTTEVDRLKFELENKGKEINSQAELISKLYKEKKELEDKVKILENELKKANAGGE